MSCNSLFFFPCFFLLQEKSNDNENSLLTPRRETRQKTLEQIAADFGDRVVEIDEQAIAAEALKMNAAVDFEEKPQVALEERMDRIA